MLCDIRHLAAGLILALAAPCMAQQGLQWETNLEDAQRQAAASGRLVLVHFSATWCQPCQRLEKTVFSQPGFGQSLASRFVAVKVDYDQHQAMATRLGVQSIPADVVLTPKGDVLYRNVSPASGEAYVAAMQRTADYAVSTGAIPSSTAALAANHTADGASAAAGTIDRYASFQSSPPQGAAPPAGPATHNASPPSHAASNQVATVAAVQLPPECPPLALDGYCPVTLVEKRAWTAGDVRWGAIHHGRTYLFCGEAEQKQFLSNPEHYSPILSGDDPVVATDEGRSIPGDRRYGVFFGDRVYLFHNENSLQTFSAQPARYAAQIGQVTRQ
jgi:protein disulfide-isomerase